MPKAKKKNPPKMKPGVWIKADKVRVVQKNGRKVVEIKRFMKKPRKRATTKRKRRK